MPTQKQLLAAQKIVKNKGNVTKTMLEVGYSEKTARTPQKLTASKGFQDLMEDYLPNEDIIKQHSQLLNKTKIITYRTKKTGKVKTYDTGEIDAPAVISALNMAYKLKGLYAPDKFQEVNQFADMSDEELEEKYNEAVAQKKRYDDATPSEAVV